MGIFGAIIGTVIETAKLPIAIIKDIATLGGVLNEHGSYITEKLEDIKDEADK